MLQTYTNKPDNKIDVHLRDGNDEHEDMNWMVISHPRVLQQRKTVMQIGMEGDTKKTALNVFLFRVTSPYFVTVTSLRLFPALSLRKYGLILSPGWRYLSKTVQVAPRSSCFSLDLLGHKDADAATLEGDSALVEECAGSVRRG